MLTMMIGRLALTVLVAGCGRVGFQELAGHGGDDDGGVAGNTVALSVVSDETSSGPAGAPIAGGADLAAIRADHTVSMTLEAR